MRTPRQPGKAPSPIYVFLGWGNPLYDDEFVATVDEFVNRLVVVAKAEGSLLDHPPALYGNYVNATTPLVGIYGDNLPRLRALKAKVDPNNAVDLTGGFRFQFLAGCASMVPADTR